MSSREKVIEEKTEFKRESFTAGKLAILDDENPMKIINSYSTYFSIFNGETGSELATQSVAITNYGVTSYRYMPIFIGIGLTRYIVMKYHKDTNYVETLFLEYYSNQAIDSKFRKITNEYFSIGAMLFFDTDRDSLLELYFDNKGEFMHPMCQNHPLNGYSFVNPECSNCGGYYYNSVSKRCEDHRANEIYGRSYLSGSGSGISTMGGKYVKAELIGEKDNNDGENNGDNGEREKKASNGSTLYFIFGTIFVILNLVVICILIKRKKSKQREVQTSNMNNTVRPAPIARIQHPDPETPRFPQITNSNSRPPLNPPPITMDFWNSNNSGEIDHPMNNIVNYPPIVNNNIEIIGVPTLPQNHIQRGESVPFQNINVRENDTIEYAKY